MGSRLIVFNGESNFNLTLAKRGWINVNPETKSKSQKKYQNPKRKNKIQTKQKKKENICGVPAK